VVEPARRVAKYGRVNTKAMGDTLNLDYSVSYRGVRNTVFNGFIRNVFDRHQVRNMMAVSAGGSGIIPQDYRDAQGRTIGIVVEYRFR